MVAILEEITFIQDKESISAAMTQQPSQPCANPPYTTYPLFPFPFFARQSADKKQLRRLWEKVERNAEAKRSGDGDPPRGCSSLIPL